MAKDIFSTTPPTPAKTSILFSSDDNLFSPSGAFGEAYGAFTLYLFLAIGAALFIYLVWGGIRYVSSSSDTKKTAEARSTIINAVIGMALFIGIYTIMSIGIGLGSTVNQLPANDIEFQSSTPTPR